MPVAAYLPPWLRRIDGSGSIPDNPPSRQPFGVAPYFIGDRIADALGRDLFASRPEFLSPCAFGLLDPAG
jgi:hypothetical protein